MFGNDCGGGGGGIMKLRGVVWVGSGRVVQRAVWVGCVYAVNVP